MNAKQAKRLRKGLQYRGSRRSLARTVLPGTLTFLEDNDYVRLVAEETGHAVLNAEQAAEMKLPAPRDGELLRVRWGPMVNAPGTARSAYQRIKRGRV